MSRTVAIIRTHALQRRLDIEHRLLEAKFEIVKERPMEFDTETEPETFYELFDSDANFLSEGPVWVYVLDHSRPAVQTLLTLLPSFDNALIAARTDAQVEMQIAALFASSPPFPPAELPPIPDELTLVGEGGGHGEIAERASNGYRQGVLPEFDAGSIRSINSGVLEALQFGLEARLALADSTTFDGSAGQLNTRAPAFMDARPSLALSDRTSTTNSSSPSAGKTPFRARPLPKTHLAPDITPRLTKAALLRQSLASSPSNSPGRPRPRPSTMGTASTGRIPAYTNKENTTSSTNKDAQERARKTFAGVPGHKRAETIGVASTKPPVVAPRLTKAAALRLGLERPTTPPGKKGPSTNTSSGRSGGKPASGVNGGNRSSVSVSPHTAPSTTTPAEEDDETETEAPVKEEPRKNIFEGVPGHKRRETISVCSVSQPPAILPRTNRSAALRKEGAPPPSSFMFRTPTVPKTPGPGSAYSRSSSVMSAYRDSGTNNGSARSQSTVPPSRASSRISQFGGYAVTKASYAARVPADGSGSETGTNGLRSTSNTTSSPSNSHTCLSDPDSYFVDVDDPHAHASDPSAPATRSRRPSSLQAPTIAPRVNKSAVLRARKAAEDAAKPKSPYANAGKR
ncbi:hypothetical protein EDD17DRAFT_1610011 [Pisolithus thermaeus]|nr:hypothetical protein EV401DRAFT_2068868 [Pisolithus croceorrhizus]KAI6159669.1 hypothetical protein EDD17DRAFT_1610011 [Pisolithus thermaeus]